jgi:hypothetical protein
LAGEDSAEENLDKSDKRLIVINTGFSNSGANLTRLTAKDGDLLFAKQCHAVSIPNSTREQKGHVKITPNLRLSPIHPAPYGLSQGTLTEQSSARRRENHTAAYLCVVRCALCRYTAEKPAIKPNP